MGRSSKRDKFRGQLSRLGEGLGPQIPLEVLRKVHFDEIRSLNLHGNNIESLEVIDTNHASTNVSPNGSDHDESDQEESFSMELKSLIEFDLSSNRLGYSSRGLAASEHEDTEEEKKPAKLPEGAFYVNNLLILTPNLETLNLAANNLHDAALTSIFSFTQKKGRNKQRAIYLRCLVKLNLAHNELRSLPKELFSAKGCPNVKELNLQDNAFDNIHEFISSLYPLRNTLEKLSLTDPGDNVASRSKPRNSICSNESYRQILVRFLSKLKRLDGVDVSDNERRDAVANGELLFLQQHLPDKKSNTPKEEKATTDKQCRPTVIAGIRGKEINGTRQTRNFDRENKENVLLSPNPDKSKKIDSTKGSNFITELRLRTAAAAALKGTTSDRKPKGYKVLNDAQSHVDPHHHALKRISCLESQIRNLTEKTLNHGKANADFPIHDANIALKPCMSLDEAREFDKCPKVTDVHPFERIIAISDMDNLTLNANIASKVESSIQTDDMPGYSPGFTTMLGLKFADLINQMIQLRRLYNKSKMAHAFVKLRYTVWAQKEKNKQETCINRAKKKFNSKQVCLVNKISELEANFTNARNEKLRLEAKIDTLSENLQKTELKYETQTELRKVSVDEINSITSKLKIALQSNQELEMKLDQSNKERGLVEQRCVSREEIISSMKTIIEDKDTEIQKIQIECSAKSVKIENMEVERKEASENDISQIAKLREELFILRAKSLAEKDTVSYWLLHFRFTKKF